MKIGYDGKRAVFNNTGLGNYSRLLVEQLAERYPDNEYILYTPAHGRNSRLQRLMMLPNVSIDDPDTPAGHRMPWLWRSYGLTGQLMRDGVELFHGLSGELPLNIQRAGIPSVVTIHDLIFRRLPRTYKPLDLLIYDIKMHRAVHAATRVIAISECTKRDVVADYGIDPDKIDVVYQGCHPQFQHRPSPDEIEEVKRRYGVESPYIIAVGTIEERKNQVMAVRGIQGLSDDVNLVLVGRRTPAYAATLDRYIDHTRIGNRVKFLENVAFADLPALYAGAFCSSYTSRYEGFGIPVIESLSVGTPVIVATGSCLEEAGGPMTPAVAPDDVEDWVAQVGNLANYPKVRERIAQEGRRYVERFNNSDFARRVMHTYTKAIEQFRNG